MAKLEMDVTSAKAIAAATTTRKMVRTVGVPRTRAVYHAPFPANFHRHSGLSRHLQYNAGRGKGRSLAARVLSP